MYRELLKEHQKIQDNWLKSHVVFTERLLYRMGFSADDLITCYNHDIELPVYNWDKGLETPVYTLKVEMVDPPEWDRLNVIKPELYFVTYQDDTLLDTTDKIMDDILSLIKQEEAVKEYKAKENFYQEIYGFNVSSLSWEELK
jgi:hypothetical protein